MNRTWGCWVRRKNATSGQFSLPEQHFFTLMALMTLRSKVLAPSRGDSDESMLNEIFDAELSTLVFFTVVTFQSFN